MFKRIVCLLFNHEFRLIQTFEPQKSQRVRCKRCNRDFVINHNVRAVLEWDKELEELYRALGNKIIDPVFTDGIPTYDLSFVQDASSRIEV
jgi:transposase-like protein